MHTDAPAGDDSVDDAALDTLAQLAGLRLPAGSHDGVRLHLATARRMLATLAPYGEDVQLAPVFRPDADDDA